MLKEYVVDKGAFGLELKQGRRTIYTYITPQIRDGGEMTARGLMIEALAADRDRLAAEVARLRAALAELRGLFAGTPGGEYAICRDDGNKLWIADDINISGVMERVDAALGEQEA